MKRGLLHDEENRSRLIASLGRCQSVRRFDSSDDNSAASLVFCLESLEGHFLEFLEEQLPRLLTDSTTEQEKCELLHEIGATLGQISWHISLPEYYRYLKNGKAAG